MTIWSRKRNRFGEVSKYAITNGTHTIAKCFVDKKPNYVLWEHGKPHKRIGTFSNAHDAKIEAEK